MLEVSRTVNIAAPVSAVWRALTDPDLTPRWMAGFRVESRWIVGEPISFVGVLNGKAVRDEGTILALEPERLLQYSHWSGVSDAPDTPESRTLVTIRLAQVEGGTEVAVRHERLTAGAVYGHAAFFWRVALAVLKTVVEG